MISAEEHARQLAQVHQDFAYAVSHDLGAPLRQIASYVELLQMSLGDRLADREQLWLNHLLQAADQSQSMLRGLLRYSRLATRHEDPTDLDLSRQVERAMQVLDLPPGALQLDVPSITLHGVASQVRTLISELVENALRHSDGDRVHVRVESSAKAIQLLVTDNGRGIPEAQRALALQLFAILDRGHAGAGMGLGLPLCQRIMQLHGGELSLDNTTAGGLEVRCSFPQVDAAEAAAA